MATASSEPLPSCEEGDEDAEVRIDDELRDASDQALEEKAQRIQNNATIIRLPDGGKKYLRSLEAVRRELARRQAARSASAQQRPPRPPGRQGEPDANRCERIIQSRCAESSGLSSDSNENHGVTKSVFLSAFKAEDEAGIDLSRQEISTTCPQKPRTSVENEGKLYEVDESCETDAQPTYLSPKASRMENSIDLENLSPDNAYLSPKASRMDNSIDLENLSPDCAFKDNGHNWIHEHASTPSRKRKGDDPGAFSMRLRSRKVQEVVLLDVDARHSESADKTTNERDAMKIYYPSSEHPQSVELSDDDIKCLEPESLLSSPIMNFYILYLQQPMSSVSTLRGKYHIFNTFFFSKLDALRSKMQWSDQGQKSRDTDGDDEQCRLLLQHIMWTDTSRLLVARSCGTKGCPRFVAVMWWLTWKPSKVSRGIGTMPAKRGLSGGTPVAGREAKPNEQGHVDTFSASQGKTKAAPHGLDDGG